MAGHSDADVLIHSLIDALLGALALGDIGKLFPDSNAEYRDIDSRILLRKAFALVKKQGWQTGNIDITVCLQEPKIGSYTEEMRYNLAGDMETDITNISIKATTEEGLGISGSKEGIVSYTVALLEERG